MNRTNMKDLKTKIAEHPFLEGFNPDYLDIFVRHAREATFKAGQALLRQSQGAYQFYLILEGTVAIESYVPRDNDLALQVLGGGDVVGWSWLFPPFNGHFQARTLE